MNRSTPPRDDLRYYMHDGSDAFRFQLAGSLSKDTARDLEQAWRTASSLIGQRPVIFDLSGLTSIDPSGQEVLSRWSRQGALLGASSYRARARLRLMTDQPVTNLANATAAPSSRFLRTTPLWFVTFFMVPFPAKAAALKTETLNIRGNYIEAVNIRHRPANGSRIVTDAGRRTLATKVTSRTGHR